MGLGDDGDGGVDACIPVTDTGRTRHGMNASRRPHTQRRTTVFLIDLPSTVFLEQQMICTATTEASAMVPYVYQGSCPVSIETHGGNVKDHRSIAICRLPGTVRVLARTPVRK